MKVGQNYLHEIQNKNKTTQNEEMCAEGNEYTQLVNGVCFSVFFSASIKFIEIVDLICSLLVNDITQDYLWSGQDAIYEA